MKYSQEKTFNPVVITLETETEVYSLLSAVNYTLDKCTNKTKEQITLLNTLYPLLKDSIYSTDI